MKDCANTGRYCTYSAEVNLSPIILCSSNTMKTMAVAKSVITAVALILLQFSYCSDAGICSGPARLTKDRKLCPQNRMPTSEGDLPCVERKCDVHSQGCGLSEGVEVNNSLISFTTQMCLTNDPPSPSQVGFMFNWTLLAGQEEVTRLKILVYNEHNFPHIWILLTVDLTGQVDSNNTKNFSTDCLASEGVEVGREYFVSVQVLPSEERYHVPDSFTFTHDCSRPKLSERALCPAAPSITPISKGFCNGKVEVTVNSGLPPGITTETEFRILVMLCPKIGSSDCLSRTKTVEVALAESEESKVYYENVKPGVYYALMAFTNKYGLPCGDNFYSEHNRTSVVNKAPRIDLRESHDVCNQTVEVTLLVTSYDQTLDQEFNVKVILSGSGVNEGQDLTKTTLITTNPNKTLVTKKVYFNGVSAGNYTISTKFADEYYTKCSSDETLELNFIDRPSFDEVSLYCGPTSFQVDIPMKMLPNDLHPNNFFLSGDSLDPSCRGFLNGDDYFSLNSSLNRCGTVFNETETLISYLNLVAYTWNTSSVVERYTADDLPVQCDYDRSEQLQSHFVTTDESSQRIKRAKGTFIYDFSMYTDMSFNVRYYSYPVETTLDRYLYFRAELLKSPDNLRIHLRSCRATPSQNFDDAVVHEFIHDGCVINDANVRLLTPSSPVQADFEIQSFRFRPDVSNYTSQVWIHCEVVVCDVNDPSSECLHDCERSRRRRSVAESSKKAKRLFQGPISFTDIEDLDQQSGFFLLMGEREEVIIFTVSLTVVCLVMFLSLLIVVGALFKIMHRVKRMELYQPLQNERYSTL